jgi:hypothetical protein
LVFSEKFGVAKIFSCKNLVVSELFANFAEYLGEKPE